MAWSMFSRQGAIKMAVTVRQVCLVMISLIPCVIGGNITQYVMENYCGKNVRLKNSGQSFTLTLTRNSPYISCVMKIESDNTDRSRSQLLVQFLDINFDCSTSRSFVQLSESETERGHQYCRGNNFRSTPYVAPGGNVYVRSISDGRPRANSFTLLISLFNTVLYHPGLELTNNTFRVWNPYLLALQDTYNCKATEFECDNERCIDNVLVNNGYDNCGDNSDENVVDSEELSLEDRFWWIWVILSALFTLAILIPTAWGVYRDKKKNVTKTPRHTELASF